MWLKATAAPATVYDDELLITPLNCLGKVRVRMIHESGDLPINYEQKAFGGNDFFAAILTLCNNSFLIGFEGAFLFLEFIVIKITK